MATPLPPAPAAIPEKPKRLLEKDVEKRVCAYAKTLGFWHKKFLSPNARAVPDRIFKIRGLDFFFIEFKRPGRAIKFPVDEHERAQLREHERIRDAGGRVYLVDNVDWGKQLLETLKALSEENLKQGYSC